MDVLIKKWGRHCFIGIVLISVGACMKNEDVVLPESNAVVSDIPIRWDVASIDVMQGHKKLIEENNGKSAQIVLQESCTPGLGDESIGIWADYQINVGDKVVKEENVFDGTQLIYQNKEDGNPYSYWNYAGKDLYWTLGAVYTFRAYYPQTAIEDKVVSSSNATTFVVDYNTAQMQYDLLLAANVIDSRTWTLTQPVPLNFKHALSALKFIFKFEDYFQNSDELTSCWLENTEANEFTNVGMLIYGGSELHKMDWIESYQPQSGFKMYYWSHDGVEFKNDGTERVSAVAYSQKGTAGDQYTNNHGWLLIIPQKSDGTVRLCFTTKAGGATVYSVPLPKITGTDFNLGETNLGSDFIPGYRYEYTLVITKTNVDVMLSIASWNELNSSFDIKIENTN